MGIELDGDVFPRILFPSQPNRAIFSLSERLENSETRHGSGRLPHQHAAFTRAIHGIEILTQRAFKSPLVRLVIVLASVVHAIDLPRQGINLRDSKSR